MYSTYTFRFAGCRLLFAALFLFFQKAEDVSVCDLRELKGEEKREVVKRLTSFLCFVHILRLKLYRLFIIFISYLYDLTMNTTDQRRLWNWAEVKVHNVQWMNETDRRK